MNPMTQVSPDEENALEQEQAGEQEEANDIDYDAIYGGLDINPEAFSTKSPELKASYAKIIGDNAKDAYKQFYKETLIGAGGTWGNLAELAGVSQTQPYEDEAKNYQDVDTLEKMNQPGYKPSIYDVASLTDDSDGPSFKTLPTTKGLGDLNKLVGGPGEPETPAGKVGQRVGKLYGGGVAFGQANPIPAIAGGIAGQGAEEAGFSELAQAGIEIAAILATGNVGGAARPVSSSKEAVQNRINALRQAGYTDEQITLAINAGSKGKKGGVQASKGSATERAFEDFAEHSDQLVSDILTAEIPGIERGIGNVHQLASDAYGQVAQQAAGVTITNPQPFHTAARRVVDQLQNTLGNNPEAAPFIRRISEAAMDIAQNPTADRVMNFYKELNGMGNWLGRNQKDRLITQVKDGIKDTFRAEGKAGRQLADDFERVNEGVQRAYRAEEVHNLIQKTAGQEGIDYKKLNKVFDNPENVHLFEQVLGPRQARNMNLIARTGKEIKDFDKAWKAVNPLSAKMALDIGTGGTAAYFLYKQDWEGLAGVLAARTGTAAVRKLAEKSLTDPKLQNLFIKGLHAIKNQSPKAYKSTEEAMKKYLEQEGIDIPLD